MIPHIPSQATFFYMGKWTHEIDEIILSTIIKMNHVPGWDGIIIHGSVLVKAGEKIPSELGVELTKSEISSRVRVLKARYNSFKDVIHTHGVIWDIPNHFVVADKDLWIEIFQRNPFVGAYYHHDDPDYFLLASVFGLSDVDPDEETTTIIISDTEEVIPSPPPTIQLGAGPNAHFNSPADPNEVNSPILGLRKKVRRNLFGEKSSTQTPSKSLYSTAGEPGMVKEEKKLCAHSTNQKNKMFEVSPLGSSCASWSPAPTSRKTAP